MKMGFSMCIQPRTIAEGITLLRNGYIYILKNAAADKNKQMQTWERVLNLN